MEWILRVNQVMDYAEEHLCDLIDEQEISRIAACSFALFQGAFTQMTELPFSEYIRRRKLSCAAYDIQNTDEKIIDIAMRYGYLSADAFTVAFKRLHGVTPIQARNPGVKLSFYGRLRFTLTMEGVDKMDYTVTGRSRFKVIGIRRVTPHGGGTWASILRISADFRGALMSLILPLHDYPFHSGGPGTRRGECMWPDRPSCRQLLSSSRRSDQRG